jgi:sigma-B regulation protein RsbQ
LQTPWTDLLHVREHAARADAVSPRTLLLAHGYGCDQSMWRLLLPLLQDHHCICFDFPGTGAGSLAAYDPARHASLQGYADTVLALVAELDRPGLVFVGHSVSGMIGALAAERRPGAFDELVMLCPSPCYRNDGPDYAGGFEAEQLEGLLQQLADNPGAWSQAVAPLIMGNPERPALADELAGAFCAMDPTIALRWARATFLTDLRAVLPNVALPTLVLQCREDAIAPPFVGRYTATNLPQGRLGWVEATGHCPQLSHPEAVARVLLAELARPGSTSAT